MAKLIGTDPNQVPTNGDLGDLAYQNKDNVKVGEITATAFFGDGSNLTGVESFTKSASDPTVTTNGTLGDVWVNTTSGEMYVLTDATTDNNVWTNVGEGVGNVPGPYMSATGGTITTDGDYKVHTFTSSGTFTVTAGSTYNDAEYLVVAGGGGSSYGGGGAGGMLSGTGLTVTSQGYTVVVGGGGAAYDIGVSAGGNGSNSSALGISATGGGGGGGYNFGCGYTSRMQAGNGGSGGGSGSHACGGTFTYYGTGISGQGNRGGNGQSVQYTSSCAGGGGGAGGVGGDCSGGTQGSAGPGLSNSITGSSVTYAKGGGTGGSGGTANTGNGGNGNGASGVVIIRYKYQ
jgi:hypothetical protein